jgi:cytochrome c oxidase subunit 2
VGLDLTRRKALQAGRLRRTVLGSLGLLLLLALTGCSTADRDQIRRLALPPAASDTAPHTADLWRGAWIAALITGILVWGLILWAIVRYRRRSDDEVPAQTRYNMPIEVLYTIVPLIVVAVLFYFTVVVQNKVLQTSAEDVAGADHTVLVLGQKWSWNFTYVRDPVLDGRTSVFDTGTPAQLPELWLPVDESVNFQLRSADVIHSFWIPSFYFKMDDIPGRHNHFVMTPTKVGTFRGRCAELCGLYHSRMLFTVRIVTAEQYAAHLLALRAQGQVGVQRPGSATTQIAGLEAAEEGGNP